jgi:hypothetical protein
VRHPPGVESLDRADRGAVVAELRVVVVLDDQAPGPRRPLHERGAARWRHHHPGRELVGGADHDRVRTEGGQPGRAQAIVVNRASGQGEPGLLDGGPQPRMRG